MSFATTAQHSGSSSGAISERRIDRSRNVAIWMLLRHSSDSSKDCGMAPGKIERPNCREAAESLCSLSSATWIGIGEFNAHSISIFFA